MLQAAVMVIGNPTLSVAKVVAGYDELGEWKLQNDSMKMSTDEMPACQMGESRNQIARYIRLT